MGGPGSGRRRKPPKAQPRGTRWLTARSACFATYGDTCWLCAHPGSTEADHVVRTDDPSAYLDVANLRPAHGARHPCEVCGKACNQSRPGRKHDGIPGANRNGNGHTQNGAGGNLGSTLVAERPAAPPGHQCNDERCPYRGARSRCW